MVKCPFCGEDNPDENKFCGECGQLLNLANDTSKQQENIQQPNNQQPLNNQNYNNQPPLNNQNYNNQPIPNNNPNFNNQQPNNNPNFNNQKYNQTITDKISNLSTPQKIIGVLAICCIGILILAAISSNTSDQGSLPSNSTSYGSSNSSSNYASNNTSSSYLNNSTNNISSSSFNKDDCKEVSYKELNKNPEKYAGESIKLKGKVLQISEGGSYGNFLLMYVDGEYDQVAYVEYLNDTDIVEDNWITVYGICGGSYSYSTQIGGSKTVPGIYGEILEKSS
jgi:hypothetical protein